MAKLIPWVVYPHAFEARLASKRNVVIVEAETAQEAFRLADAGNPYGETYGIGFSAVKLSAVLGKLGGSIVVVGNLNTTPKFDSEP